MTLIFSYAVVFTTAYVVVYCFLYKYFLVTNSDEKTEIDRWIHENDLAIYKNIFDTKGFDKLEHFATIDSISQLTIIEEDHLKRASSSLREKLIFDQWLKSLGLHQYFFKLSKEEINSLEDVYLLDDAKAHEILGKDFATWTRGRQMLPSTKEALETLKLHLWNDFISSNHTVNTIKMLRFSVLVSVGFAGVLILICRYQFWFAMRSDASLLHVITGRYLDPGMCKVEFGWSDPCPVGETVNFIIKFFQRNGFPYPVCDKDNVQIEISFGVRKISCMVSLGGTAPEDANLGTVKFSVRYAGAYQINVCVRNVHVPGSPFKKTFLPGAVDPTKTKFERHSSIVICCPNSTCTLMIQPRDSFQNLCLTSSFVESTNYVDLDLYHSVVKQNDIERSDVCFQSFNWDKTSSKISFEMIFLKEGCYQVQVFYQNILLQNGDFTCIVLNRTEYELTSRSVKNRSISYEGKLTRIEGEPPFKPKRVIMYISSKQFTIKEFMLKFLLKRLATFRLCPSTKIQILDETANGVPSFSVDDGCQPIIYLAAHNRNVIAATFTKFLLNNIGGSETFTEKQYFFYYEVRRYHQKHRHEPITVKVDRQDLLKSSLKATKNFTLKEWCSNFEVIFVGEIGVDWGGLRREWFQLTCELLFKPSNNLFKGFSDNPQALVHPYKNRPPNLKLKYYEFAGRLLGKCLYESALGDSYSQFVTAKFTRSFLAQLIGLRINHNYFQSDDPDLYITKIRYILENDVSNMDLYFVDEEYDNAGQLTKVVELITNGSKISVTNSTKRQYLDSLAQYRLATSVKEEIETFLKGLNEIIPDNLLCIFDENELELLLCGTGEYSISDFRAHHVVNRQYPVPTDFERVLKWFWIAVSNFTTEEMARLLQFTTGSSQLPPGGFKDLKPQFQIVPVPSHGTLPTAHTCFNQLCLPYYENYEQFEKSLLLAITEGTEGFGLI